MTSRRDFLRGAGTLGALAALDRLAPAYAWTDALTAASAGRRGAVFDLAIAETPFRVRDRTTTALMVNATIPAPLLRFREKEEVVLRVANRLRESASIHWHGLLVPNAMDGVPGVTFAGISPGTTFVYRFALPHSGTYWYHSHSGLQELRGVYGPIIIDPIEPDPFHYDREYVVLLSDWSIEPPERVLANLKKQAGYYNFQKRTAREFFSEARRRGLGRTLGDFLTWSRMRMDPTDFTDVSSYALVHLMNGLPAESNWTALFKPGERVRLRFINAGTITFYDVRIPGLPLTVVQADGQNVQPVEVDEFRMGPAETYDVIVKPKANTAYTIFAETMDRSGYARGTLAPGSGMSAAIPKHRPRPVRNMMDMGMAMEGMGGMEMEGMQMPGMNMPGMAKDSAGEHGNMPGMGKDSAAAHMNMPGMNQDSAAAHMNMPEKYRVRSEIPGSSPVPHGPDSHGTGNQAVPEITQSRLQDPGDGLGKDGWRVLAYTDLKAHTPSPDRRPPERELELHVTGHMERFMWSFDGKKHSDARDPIVFRHGERLRWTFVNDTMMEHPLHLHGMFMELENGTGDYLPRKHTIIVKPAERVSVAITADARGQWAFHCHLLLHMEAGMFRIVRVADAPAGPPT